MRTPLGGGSRPGAQPDSDELIIRQTLTSITASSRLFRLISGSALLAAGIGALVLGALLGSSVHGTRPVVFLMLEPAGVFLICVALVALAPQSIAASWFRGAYSHLRITLLVLALAGGIGALLLVGSLLIELLRQ